MIPKQAFGRTGHASTRLIFGAYALSQAKPAEADRILELLLAYGVNHIDVAPMYGDAEKRIGPWMEKHRDAFFLATKTYRRTYRGAWDDLRHSLERLRVDHVDLWQMHNLTGPAAWEQAMGPGGALEAFVEAREQGLVRFLGVTGHGLKAPAMHRRSLERFDLDTVLLPYNYPLMQKPRYAADFTALVALCRERDVAVQTIKSIARRPWGGRPRTFNTYFYEPLDTQAAIDKAVHWVLAHDFLAAELAQAGSMTEFTIARGSRPWRQVPAIDKTCSHGYTGSSSSTPTPLGTGRPAGPVERKKPWRSRPSSSCRTPRPASVCWRSTCWPATPWARPRCSSSATPTWTAPPATSAPPATPCASARPPAAYCSPSRR